MLPLLLLFSYSGVLLISNGRLSSVMPRYCFDSRGGFWRKTVLIYSVFFTVTIICLLYDRRDWISILTGQYSNFNKSGGALPPLALYCIPLSVGACGCSIAAHDGMRSERMAFSRNPYKTHTDTIKPIPQAYNKL